MKRGGNPKEERMRYCCGKGEKGMRRKKATAKERKGKTIRNIAKRGI